MTLWAETGRGILHPMLILSTWAFLSVGCGSSKEKAVEQTTEETHPIDPAAGTLSIRNSLGSVWIYGSDESEMKLTVVKKARSAKQLSAIGVRVSARSGSVSIETSFPSQKPWLFSKQSGKVDCTIRVPRRGKISRLEIGNGGVLIENMQGDIHANVVNGALATRNCFGNADLTVANGDLDLFYEKWEKGKFTVNARIISGKVRAFFPGNASFHLGAETIHGNITDHLVEASQQNPGRATKVSMSMGTDINGEITIRATDGNIEIAPIKAASNSP